MFVPIHTEDGEYGSENNATALYARRWGVFYVTYDGGTDEYHGRLIKNYPMHTDGLNGWDSTYVGPLNITLVETP